MLLSPTPLQLDGAAGSIPPRSTTTTATATTTTIPTTIDHNDNMADSLDQSLPGSAAGAGPAAGSSSPVKRACDACHRRKVKCVGDGSRPCKNCTLASLTCTYNAVPQKKGPKGSRAKVISELRQTQRQTQPPIGRSVFDVEAMHAASTMRTPGLVSVELITACVDYYFTNLYPTQPILHRVKVGETIGQMEINVEAYCLITSLCA
ncbi:MAG: Zn(II)2Cys6 transcription factor, partial [Terriglobus roseus]|nr:Zn(II)2Cys6 transcription factor [Terriglobus roseus]